MLSEQRKTRKVSPTYPKKEDIKKYTEIGAYPVHESIKPGIVDLDIHPVHEQFVISVGRDQKAVLFDIKQSKILKKLDPIGAKSKASLTCTKFVPG